MFSENLQVKVMNKTEITMNKRIYLVPSILGMIKMVIYEY